jgi:hypothetical protein
MSIGSQFVSIWVCKHDHEAAPVGMSFTIQLNKILVADVGVPPARAGKERSHARTPAHCRACPVHCRARRSSPSRAASTGSPGECCSAWAGRRRWRSRCRTEWPPSPPSASTRFGRDWSAVTHSARSVFGLITKLSGRAISESDQPVRVGLAHGGDHELRSPGGHPIAALREIREVGGIDRDLLDVRHRAGFLAHASVADAVIVMGSPTGTPACAD